MANTRSLAGRDPSWGSTVSPFAGGWLVLAGRGMYLNQALSAGVEVEITEDGLDRLIERSVAVGVVPTVEVTANTGAASLRAIEDRGFRHDAAVDIAALTRPVGRGDVGAPDDVVVVPVETEAAFRRWQETSAAAWGHVAAEARLASDAFAAAANALDNEHLTLAVDTSDGRPLGCAVLTIRDGVAMLGGMSTLPVERRRGVQAALIRHRLARALDLGCDLAVTTAASGGPSERNLRRHGFSPLATIRRFTLPAAR